MQNVTDSKAIAIVGATSLIAKDLIINFASDNATRLILYGRNVDEIHRWLTSQNLEGRFVVADYASYGALDHDVVINFVGVGDPAVALAMGASIFDITLNFDQMIIRELEKNTHRRYIFISSGAVYGSNFAKPVSLESHSIINVNSLKSHEFYTVAKLYAECTHRSLSHLAITDLRVFNYFSSATNLDARFFITDLMRAVIGKSVLEVSGGEMVRDYIHPQDFYQLICRVIHAPEKNTAIDCYSMEPISKAKILKNFSEKFGLRWLIVGDDRNTVPDISRLKENYFSKNRMASEFGYKPSFSSLDALFECAEKILERKLVDK